MPMVQILEPEGFVGASVERDGAKYGQGIVAGAYGFLDRAIVEPNAKFSQICVPVAAASSQDGNVAQDSFVNTLKSAMGKKEVPKMHVDVNSIFASCIPQFGRSQVRSTSWSS